jgi:hypothetical protein
VVELPSDQVRILFCEGLHIVEISGDLCPWKSRCTT